LDDGCRRAWVLGLPRVRSCGWARETPRILVVTMDERDAAWMTVTMDERE